MALSGTTERTTLLPSGEVNWRRFAVAVGAHRRSTPGTRLTLDIHGAEDISRLALSMVQDVRSRAGIGDFYRWWLNLDLLPAVQPDPALFPDFNAQLARDMIDETTTFGAAVTQDPNGSFARLLVAPYSYLNQSRAAVYGVPGISGTELRLVNLDPTRRAGLFTQPSFLTVNSTSDSTSAMRRGRFITEGLFCNPLPPPPVSTTPLPPATSPGGTARQRLAAVTDTSPACTPCHSRMEGIGYAFENFDAIGKYRTTDNGLPIDASAQLPNDTSISINGAPELARVLSTNALAQQCLSRKWVEYALGGRVVANDDLAVTEAHQVFAASGFLLRDLIAGVAQTDAFLTHNPACTPGRDQTCNDDPAISSLHGNCTPAARCICTIGSGINPQTGRCF